MSRVADDYALIRDMLDRCEREGKDPRVGHGLEFGEVGLPGFWQVRFVSDPPWIDDGPTEMTTEMWNYLLDRSRR